jgi:hypothetical protein
MLYEFCCEGCHQYLVQAKNVTEASEKFISWQNKTLEKDDRWPESVIKNKSNWMKSDIIFIGDLKKE